MPAHPSLGCLILFLFIHPENSGKSTLLTLDRYLFHVSKSNPKKELARPPRVNTRILNSVSQDVAPILIHSPFPNFLFYAVLLYSAPPVSDPVHIFCLLIVY